MCFARAAAFSGDLWRLRLPAKIKSGNLLIVLALLLNFPVLMWAEEHEELFLVLALTVLVTKNHSRP